MNISCEKKDKLNENENIKLNYNGRLAPEKRNDDDKKRQER